MERERYLQCLAADHARLREVAAADLGAAVPTCPEWTVADLVRHVAIVYLHKVECMRLGVMPQAWPPDVSGEDPRALLDRAYAALRHEFATRSSDAPAATWFEPDQTVGYWIRRMAQETVIHRVDAELARGATVSAVPADLAVDGIEEVLERFLAYGSRRWPEEFVEELSTCDGRAVLVASGGARWLVRLDRDGVSVGPDPTGQAGAQVSGDPQGVLLWLWRRAGDDAVRTDGDSALVAQLRALLGAATR
jgi:uncharacterized protein (TIGR03083 family)